MASFSRCVLADDHPLSPDPISHSLTRRIGGLRATPQRRGADVPPEPFRNVMSDVIGGSTHISLIVDKEDTAATTQAILDVVSSVRSAGPLVR